jgi:hypothetical protein
MLCDTYVTPARGLGIHLQGFLELQPGCNMEQSLEAQLTGVLNGIREQAGKVRTGKQHLRW